MKIVYYLIFLLVLLASCKKEKEIPDNVIIRFEDIYLTKEEIIDQIPEGISQNDSVALFDALVDTWIKDNVLSDFAEERLYDLSEINRRVKDYRNALIVQEYLKKMRASKNIKFDETKVREYYSDHRKELKLDVPLVKGIFLKINSDSKGKAEIKKLLSSKNIEDIDKFEQKWLDQAIEYNYFRDKWIDWETVSVLIPYRFGDSSKFLEENNFFETEYDDCTYFLQITDYLPIGEEQPYDFAKIWITDILNQGELAEYERALVNSLIEKSIKDKKLEIIGYDPLTHELKKNTR